MTGAKTDTLQMKPAAADPPESETTDRGEEAAISNVEDSVEEGTGEADGDCDRRAGVRPAKNQRGSDGRSQRRLAISVSARSVVYGALVATLLVAVATFSWLYIDARRELGAQTHRSSNYAHAEKIALDYAVNAATMNFQDLKGWKTKLVAGTSTALNEKLTKAAQSMEQILVPLQWNSTAEPLVAKVHSDTGGVYVVDCFVSVETKTAQAPDALRSTATYSLTMDSNKNWEITDVGGIGSVVGQK